MLFPVVLQKGDAQEKQLVRQLREEHPRIRRDAAGFRDLVCDYASDPKEGRVLEITDANRKLVELIVAHAQREEEELFPVLRKYAAS